jgi:hypothetical protein
MSRQRTAYVQARTHLLEQMTSTLQKDERFVAAWLAGSFSRGEQTWLSDLDIHVVIADTYSESLCATPWPSGVKTTPERLVLFQQFGTPGIIFEDHRHNQLGGTFTHVVYRESAHNVDWMLIPQANAYQESPCLLLFDKVGLPEPPLQEPERAPFEGELGPSGLSIQPIESRRSCFEQLDQMEFCSQALPPLFECLFLLSTEQAIPMHKHSFSGENGLRKECLQHITRDGFPFQRSVIQSVL